MIRLTIILTSLVVFSCASPSAKDWKHLQGQEKAFFDEAKEKAIVKTDAETLLKEYNLFLEAHPKFEENPEIMLRQADVYLGIDQWFMALKVFTNFEKLYPTHKRIGFVSFSKGMVCEMAYHKSSYPKHKEYSIALYNEFLEKYPDHFLTESARGSIKSMK